MKRQLTILCAVLVTAACGGGLLPQVERSAAHPAPEQRSVRIAAVGADKFLQMPLTLANELGYSAAAGVTFTIINVSSGNAALALLGSGEADMVSIPYEFAIRAQAQGNAVKMVILLSRSPLVLVVSSLHSNEVRSMKDLVGKPVGITAPGTASEGFVRLLAIRDGVDPSSIPLKSIGIDQQNTNAIASGAVWAGQTLDPDATEMEHDGTGVVLPESDTRSAAIENRVFGGFEAHIGLLANPEFIATKPNTVLAVVTAELRALRFIRTHSADDIAAHMPSAFKGGEPEIYAQALAKNITTFTADGRLPQGAARRVLTNLELVVPGLPADSIDLSRTYDDTFINRAG